MLVDDLVKFCKGHLDLTPTQVQCSLKLVGKFMPDLQASSVEVNHNHNLVDIHTLNARLAALGHDPETVFKRISTNQVIEADCEKIESCEDSIQDPPTPESPDG